jgi:hypothetical protein
MKKYVTSVPRLTAMVERQRRAGRKTGEVTIVTRNFRAGTDRQLRQQARADHFECLAHASELPGLSMMMASQRSSVGPDIVIVVVEYM